MENANQKRVKLIDIRIMPYTIRKVFYEMCGYGDYDTGTRIRPSNQSLSHDTEKCLKTVQRAKKWLRDNRVIIKTKIHNMRLQTCDEYMINFDILDNLIHLSNELRQGDVIKKKLRATAKKIINNSIQPMRDVFDQMRAKMSLLHTQAILPKSMDKMSPYTNTTLIQDLSEERGDENEEIDLVKIAIKSLLETPFIKKYNNLLLSIPTSESQEKTLRMID